ncbi:MAG: MBL fold metallo-hydrolase [Oscillospiraceae bacterium]|nr:MBL fold metallo-hydrolase [Oscillospiraceae bacterium]
MKLVFLTDNSVLSDNLIAEHGMSVYVEKGDITLLFDTGLRGAIRHNANQLGVDLTKVNVVAFSHNHNDHSAGFATINDLISADCPILLHKGFPVRKYWDHRFDGDTDPKTKYLEMNGPGMSLEWFFVNGKYNMRVIEDDLYKVTDDIYLVSNFPVQRGIEAISPNLRMETPSGDYVVDEARDEQVCVIRTVHGLVILSGCAHNGIMNIIETVKKHFPGEKVHAVYGGTHMTPYNKQRVEETIKYFNESGIEHIGVCHCTGPAIPDFSRGVKCFSKVSAGTIIEIEE